MSERHPNSDHFYSRAARDAMNAVIAKPLLQSGRVISPVPRHGEGKSLMRLPVVDTRGVALMPCTERR